MTGRDRLKRAIAPTVRAGYGSAPGRSAARRGAVPAPPDRDALYGSLLGRILDGTYVAGSRLPSEEDLANEFGVSRPLLRQALARLREEDFIVSRRGSGSYVRGPEEPQPAPFSPISCIADIGHCFEFRTTIESRAAALAARNHGAAELAALHAAYDHLEAVLGTGALGNDADFRFHDAIAVGSGNRYYLEALQALRPSIVACMRLLPRPAQRRAPARIARVRAEHRAILDAIVARDEAAAAAAMAEHITSAQRRIFEGDAALDVDQ